MAKIATLVNFGRYIDVKIGSLADSHIKQFGLRLAAGERGDPRVNPEECQKYLSLWESIQAKEGKNLNAEEHAEVMEALDSGEFDYLVGAQSINGFRLPRKCAALDQDPEIGFQHCWFQGGICIHCHCSYLEESKKK